MFKVENLVDNLAFWLSFIRELLDTLLSPPGQNPLKRARKIVSFSRVHFPENGHFDQFLGHFSSASDLRPSEKKSKFEKFKNFQKNSALFVCADSILFHLQDLKTKSSGRKSGAEEFMVANFKNLSITLVKKYTF